MREEVIAQFKRYQQAMGQEDIQKILPINGYDSPTWGELDNISDRDLIKLVASFSRLYQVRF